MSRTVARHDRVKEPQRELEAHVWEVTPELAAEWLKTKKINRNVRPSRVRFFTHLLETGKFVMTGEPAQFEGFLGDSDVHLVNGQHRLEAITKARTGMITDGDGDEFMSKFTGSARLLVVQGVEPGSQVFMDSGARRNFSDVLAMERNVKEARSLAATARLGLLMEQGRAGALVAGGGQDLPNNSELLEWFDRHPDAPEAVAMARQVRRELGANEPAMAVAYMLFSGIDADECADFFDKLVTMANLPQDDPVLVLRRWMTNAMGKRPRPRAAIQLAVTIKAWNSRRGDAPLRQLRWRPYGPNAEDFPSAA